MPITEAQLLRILPNARPVAGVFVPALNQAMARYRITIGMLTGIACMYVTMANVEPIIYAEECVPAI